LRPQYITLLFQLSPLFASFRYLCLVLSFALRPVDPRADKTLDKYKEFLELVINTNKMFSSSFLVCVAFYFVSTLMRVVAMYCSIHDKMENIMNAVEIFILLASVAKLVLIVVIPTGSMGKVKCNEWCLEAIDHTRFRLTK
jgi:hypothetical protein